MRGVENFGRSGNCMPYVQDYNRIKHNGHQVICYNSHGVTVNQKPEVPANGFVDRRRPVSNAGCPYCPGLGAGPVLRDVLSVDIRTAYQTVVERCAQA